MPIYSQLSEKNLPESLKKGPRRKRVSGPSYLYLKGNVFYFRYVFSEENQRRFVKREFRLSLKTGLIRSARRLASILRADLEVVLMANSDKTYAEVRKEMVSKLHALLNSTGERKHLSLEAIRKRMDLLLREVLNDQDSRLFNQPQGVLFDQGVPVKVCAADSLEHSFRVFLKNIVNDKSQLNVANYPETILELLHKNIFSVEEMSESALPLILNEFIKMQIVLNRIYLSRENGDYLYERNFNRFVETESEYKLEKNESKKLLLTDLIELYVNTKIEDNQWKVHTIPDRRNRLDYLTDILGNKNVKDISREDMRLFREILRKLPPNRKKSIKYRGKSIEEILKIAPDDVLNVKTVNIVIEAAASMFGWAIREGYLDNNPATSLQIKDDRQEISLRESFNVDEIKLIFYSDLYNRNGFKHAAYYWAPLIGLYSGMRLEEICQLHCSDVKCEGGIWYFDINANSNGGILDTKLIKTKSSIRCVPVHDELIALGLIDYIRYVKNMGHCRIFYELNKTDKSPKYGKQVTKSFTRLLSSSGITGKKSFHSLRHSFSDFYKKRNLHNDVFRQVFGHEIVELAGKQYGALFSVEQCYTDIIAKLDYIR